MEQLEGAIHAMKSDLFFSGRIQAKISPRNPASVCIYLANWNISISWIIWFYCQTALTVRKPPNIGLKTALSYT